VEVEFEYGSKNALLGELKGGEAIYYAMNLTNSAAPEETTPSFFTCLSHLNPKNEIFACVSQGIAPSFDDCKRAYDVAMNEEYDEEVSEGELASNSVTLIPQCGLKMDLTEFGVCNSRDLLWVSVFSASDDLYRPHTFDLPFIYSDCEECSLGMMDCIFNPWLLVSGVLSICFLFCSLCSFFVLVIFSKKQTSNTQ